MYKVYFSFLFWLRKYMYVPRSLSLFILHTNPLCQNIFPHLEITTMKNDNNTPFLYVGYFLYQILCISFSTECATGYFGKTCQISCRYPNYGHLYEMICTCKKQYCSHIKCYQVWKITCNNAICGQRLIIWQESLFWLVFQNVIKITSILSLLNEATTIKNIFSKSIDTRTYNCFTSIRLKRYFWLVEKKEFGCLCQQNWA